jgi:D-alanyl-D-alanine carboxypeptidase (penicillin-binding protein 5/6)
MPSRLQHFRNALALPLALMVLVGLATPTRAFETEAKQAILYDTANDAVLFAKDADTPFPPASLAKLMTLGVAFDEMKRGWISPATPYRVSEHAWRTGGGPARTTSMFAKLNTDVPAQDLIRGVAIVSGSDAAIALAEGMAKTEGDFAERMNALGKEIGLTNSTFVNATGLPAPGQQTTVRDLSRIATYLAVRHPDFYKVFSEPFLDWNRIKQTNRNPLFGQYDGVDGLMIGSVAEQGHMIAVSALRNGKRLVAVLAGLPDDAVRVKAAKALLDLGFNGYIERELFLPNAKIADAQVFGGTSRSVRLVSPDLVRLPVPKDGDSRLTARAVYRGPVTAPVARGDRIGTLRIWRDGLLQREVPLVADEDVAEGTLLRRAFDATYELAAGAVNLVMARFL